MGSMLSLVLVGLPVYACSQPMVAVDAHGDPLPEWAVARIGTVRLRHGNQVASIAFSHDGARIISTDWYSVGIWDRHTGRSLRFHLLGPQYGCWPVVSADGSLIACRLENG